MALTGISANRLELLQIADAVAREKSIEKEIVIEAIEEAITKGARSRYGAEHDIRATINPNTGELTLTRYITVVEDDAETEGLLGVLRDVPDDEQAVANGAVVPSRQDDMPRAISAPIRMSFAPEPAAPGAGPDHGAHTDEVLRELGYEDAQLDKLRAAGAFG